MSPFGKSRSDEADGFAEDSTESGLVAVHNQYLALVEDPTVTDPKAAALQIVNRIMSADSIEALEQIVSSGTVDASALIGVPFIIEEDQWFKSAPKYQENSAGVFVVLTCKRVDTGESVVVTAGGENVVAIVFKMHTLGAIPTQKPWTFRSADTAAGYTTYWLIPAVVPAQQ